MEREKETHKTGIPRVRLPAVSGPARPTKEQLQTPGSRLLTLGPPTPPRQTSRAAGAPTPPPAA